MVRSRPGRQPWEPWFATGEACCHDPLTGGGAIAAFGHTRLLVQPKMLDNSAHAGPINDTLDVMRLIRLLGGTLAISQTVAEDLRRSY